MPGRLASALLVLFVTLAGCSGGRSADFTVPDDADAHATIRAADNGTEPPSPYTLRVQVRHERADGPPITGAAVVFFDASQGAQTEGARTGDDGDVIADFYVGGTISLAAGGVEGFTTEELPGLVLGDPGEEDTVVILLYSAQKTLQASGSFPLSPATPTNVAYADVPVAFAEGAAAQAYLQRLVGLEAILRWDNGPAGSGDLYAAAASADDADFVHGDDAQQLPTDTGNEEVLTLDEGAARSLGDAAAAGGGLVLRAETRQPVVTVGGLPFTFDAAATFQGSDLVIR